MGTKLYRGTPGVYGKTIIEFSHYFMIDDKLDLKIVYETVQINYNLIEMT